MHGLLLHEQRNHLRQVEQRLVDHLTLLHAATLQVVLNVGGTFTPSQVHEYEVGSEHRRRLGLLPEYLNLELKYRMRTAAVLVQHGLGVVTVAFTSLDHFDDLVQ
jgi:hypothetical protein